LGSVRSIMAGSLSGVGAASVGGVLLAACCAPANAGRTPTATAVAMVAMMSRRIT
jgi:hypothetical protein